MSEIKVSMIDAIKVQFLKPIFEDDFPDKGMKAYLTDIKFSETSDCYKLFFDFSEFESENMKYFKTEYYPNIHTKKLQNETGRRFFTAIEAGFYKPKYSIYFSTSDDSKNDELFEKEILNYLRVVE